MAAYPSVLKQSPETRVTPIVGKMVDMSTNGTVRGRDLHDATVYDITCVNILVPDADKATLETFYDTNRNLEITWTDKGDSTVYDVIFLSRPLFVWTSHGYWKVTTKLRGTAQ